MTKPLSPHDLETGAPADAAEHGDVLPTPDDAELEAITAALIAEFKTVFDPEIPVDIYELGLIYKIEISDSRHVDVDMTLTAPGCPVAGEMPTWVEEAALRAPGVKSVKAHLVFDPPWSPSRMSDEAKLELNML